MYIMLLTVYYSSFSAFTACTFDWLIDGRSLAKTKLNYLINSVCFRVRKLLCESTQWKVHYMVHKIWKIQYHFADVKKDWFTWWWLSIFTRYCTLNSSYCKKRHIFSIPSFYKLYFSVIKPTWLAFKICRKRVTRSFFMDNFDLVLLNKLTYSLILLLFVLFLQKQPLEVFSKKRRT